MSLRNTRNHLLQSLPVRLATKAALLTLSVCTLWSISGCGADKIVSAAATGSSATINAGQVIQIPTATAATTNWTVTGTACSDKTCGTVVPSTDFVTYTAPPAVGSQIHVTGSVIGPGSTAGSTFDVTVNPALALDATLSDGSVDTQYTATVSATGGSNPRQISLSDGALPDGLQFNASNGIISGTPKTDGDYPVTFKATDASNAPTITQLQRTLHITRRGSGSAAALHVTTASLASGTVSTAYQTQLAATGGTAPYTWSVTAGALPAGITVTSSGDIQGTPTAAGLASFAVQTLDSNGTSAAASLKLTINSAQTTLAIGDTTLSPAQVNTAYAAQFNISGGTAPYTCTVVASTLPKGLQQNGCGITGTPTTAGSTTFELSVTDAGGASTSSPIALTVAPTTLTVLTSSLPSTVVGSTYATNLSIAGGVAPYTCTVKSGALPAGLTLNNCQIAGTATSAGTTTLVVAATDAAGASASSNTLSLTVAPQPTTLTISSPSVATVGSAYVGTINVAGGTAPYSCTLASGTIPSGLTLTGCSLTGTPTTAGTTALGIKATDASSPANTTTSLITMTINAAAQKTLTIVAPPAGTVGTAYNGAINVAGGTAPYSCALTSGSVPTGLTLSGCNLTGTPTTAGTTAVGIRATDASSPANTTTSSIAVTINAAAQKTLTIAAPPAGTVGTAYNGAINVGGGTAPYGCTLASGSVPTGLTLSGCSLAGTPSVAGNYSFAIKATDASSPSNTSTAALTINIAAAPVKLVIGTLSAATVGTAYNGAITVTGGTAPYTCSLVSGTVPSGLAMSNCLISGTPKTAGSVNLVVKADDASTPSASVTATVTLLVNAAASSLVITSPPAATVGTAYTGAIGITGGVAPYTCSLASGTVPAGLTLNGCTLTGTPATAGAYTLGIKALDSSVAAITTTGTITVTVKAAQVTLALASPSAATVGVAYSGTIGVSGGTGPYTCKLASGTVPAGLTLNGCALTGTPTTSGSSQLSIQATDSSSIANVTTGNVTVTVNAAQVTLVLTSPSAATVGVAYSGTIGVSGGTAPYTCKLASGTVPAGLTLNGCALTGTPTTAGSSQLSIQATDSSSPANATTGTVTAVVNAAPPVTSSGTPHINYTDLNVGSGSGGDTGNGVYVRIFGSNFGASQGSGTVTLGGSLVTNCSLCSWSNTQIIAQLGSQATTGQIVVTANGLQSNGVPFTVTPTTIVFVSPNGSDSNSGTFASPFKSWRAAFNSVTSNDSKSPSQNTVIYLEPGTDVSFDDGRGYKSAISTDLGGTSATNQLSIVGFPGGTVNVGSTSISYGTHGWGKFVTIANLNIVGQVSAIDAEAGNSRIINNSLSCPAPPSGLGGTACVLGETSDPTETWAFQGNNVHDTGGNVDKTYHAVYFSSNVNHADVGWNNVGQNFKGYCRGIMFHATEGANQFDLHIHDNIVTNSYCDGIGLASTDPSQGTVEIYNNVVAHAALASNPYGVANEVGIAINSDPAGSSSGTVEIYNNTVVDAGAYTTGNQNGCFGVVSSGAGIHLTNNICSQPSAAQPYIEKGSTNVSGSNNLWFGAGAAPSWDSAPITSDPLLNSTTFSLQSGSPASGNGTTTITSPFDIIGVPRGSRPSLGAYQ